jgi:hypothetical protein
LIDVPNSGFTVVTSINNAGEIAGGCNAGNTFESGFTSFVRDRYGNILVVNANGSFTHITGINDGGDTTGYLIDFLDNIENGSFVRDRHGNLTFFNPPNVRISAASSINNAGQVAGVSDPLSIGFVRDANGSFTFLDLPRPFGLTINDGGEVAGVFPDPSQGNKNRGFVRDPNGNITVFDPPNAASTFSISINNGGDVTGTFFDASQGNKQRGFVRSAVSVQVN